MKRACLLVAAVLLAGCGGNKSSQPAPTSPGTSAETGTGTSGTNEGQAQQVLDLYFVDPSDGKLFATQTQIEPTRAVGAAALQALSQDPDSEVPPNLSVSIDHGAATVTGSQLSPAALAQVVYTLTQFATVHSVNGKTRKDQAVEDFVPPILVEHPAADTTVRSPLRVTGNANTFEATFEYDLVDDTGKVLSHHFETATSGSGERGTFDFTISFHVTEPTNGSLVVYESSAEDGSRIHERTIPLTLAP